MEDLRFFWNWSGAVYGFEIPNVTVPMSRVRQMLMEGKLWYGDAHRPMICEYQSAHCVTSLRLAMTQWTLTRQDGVGSDGSPVTHLTQR